MNGVRQSEVGETPTSSASPSLAGWQAWKQALEGLKMLGNARLRLANHLPKNTLPAAFCSSTLSKRRAGAVSKQEAAIIDPRRKQQQHHQQ